MVSGRRVHVTGAQRAAHDPSGPTRGKTRFNLENRDLDNTH